jgi:phage antirepressor YoqD-like protein
MNNLTSSEVKTMSSREIAALVETSHDSVLKTIRSLIERGIVFGNETHYIHPQNNQQYPEYKLSFRDTMIISSGYSVELRAKIIDRWQELEAKQQFQIPTTLSGALKLAAAQAEMIEAQTQVIEQQKPAVEFVERYIDSTGSKGFREVCKLLKVNESRFKEFLISNEIMYQLGGKLTPYAPHIDAGRFEINAGIADNEHAYTTAKFTPKGINWVAGLWAVHNLEQ